MNKTDETILYTQNNYIRGSVGAFLGAFIGAIPWAFVYNMGWFVGWLGYLIGFLAKKGYEILGGKKAKGKILIICGATVFAVVLGTILPDLFDIAKMIHYRKIRDAMYSDIPSLYVNWVSYNGLLPHILRNIGLGLIFGLVGISSILREMAAETNPNLVKAVTPENISKEELDSSLAGFSVFYSPKRNALFVIVLIPIFTIAFFVIYALAAGGTFSLSNFAGLLAFSLPFFAFIGLSYFIYFKRLKKFKIEVNGDTLKITPVFGKEKTVRIKDITKVAIYPPNAITSVYFHMKAYSNGKKLFNVNNLYSGANELMRRLKAEGIMFVDTITPL